MIKNYQEVLAEDDTVSDHSAMVLAAVLARWTGLAGYNVKAGYTATLVADG